jgi:hypothetical protein
MYKLVQCAKKTLGALGLYKLSHSNLLNQKFLIEFWEKLNEKYPQKKNQNIEHLDYDHKH